MRTFVRYKGGDDLRVTRKPLIATHARGENARFKQTCYHCHNPLLRIVKHKTKDLYDASQWQYGTITAAGDRQRLHQIERGNDAGLLYHSSSIADENHRFPKGNHVTGTDTPSGPGIEELSC